MMRPRAALLIVPPLLLVVLLLGPAGSPAVAAREEQPAGTAPAVSVTPSKGAPLDIRADQIDYLQNVDVYEARGSVVIVQGPIRLTADRVTLMMLTGTAIAEGHVHLTDPTADVEAERLELDVNTEAGVITNGTVFIKESDTLITGRLLQRFSESHYRVKEGSFTNCDARFGQVPAWRFTFDDMDLTIGEGVYAKSARFCVNDVPILPFPTLYYPIQTARKTGFLIPTVGYDNRFGFHYRQGFFWAVNPSQDVMIAPDFLSNRGYGGDLQYRYAIDGRSRGQWLTSFIQDTELNKSRGLLSGLHYHEVNPGLRVAAQAFLTTDSAYLSDLSNSGVLRALPSGDSSVMITQRVPYGNVYLLGLYLQPLQAGGKDTFQRLPEIGYQVFNYAPLDGPILLGLDTSASNFYRDVGFNFQRVDVVPSISTKVWEIGHVVGFVPEVKLREVYYTQNITNTGPVSRETFWASMQGASRLSRRFRFEDGSSVLHTIEPTITYEFVPRTPQNQIVQIDGVDDLLQKNLITYTLNSHLVRHAPNGTTSWLDFLIAQSYHPGSTPNRAVDFGVLPQVGTLTQPLQLPSVPVHTNKFSNIWLRSVIGNPVGTIRDIDQVLSVDAFFDPYQGTFSQFNTDLRFQHERDWYIEIGQRYAREGLRTRRGDIWNPISFNEVFAPTPEITFATISAAFRGPFGTVFGGRTYYDVKSGRSPETDLVALYRNPCQCWSVGFYYIQFPDRVQYNLMLTLSGIGTTETFGTQIIRYLLQPLLINERALPWPSPYGKRTSPRPEPVGPPLPGLP